MIVVEYLSRLVTEAARSGRIELYTSGGAVVESHLAFADDVIIFFCRSSRKTITALREVLDEFADFSGLTINRNKSVAIFFMRVTNSNKLAGILGFQTGTSLTGKSVTQ